MVRPQKCMNPATSTRERRTLRRTRPELRTSLRRRRVVRATQPVGEG